MNPPHPFSGKQYIMLPIDSRGISSEVSRIGDRMFPWAVSSRSLSKTIWLVKLVVYVTGPDPFGRSGREGLSNREWWVSTHHFGHSDKSDNAIPGGVEIRALDPFVGPGGISCDAGLGFGEPTGRSSAFSIGNSLFFAPAVALPWLHLRNTPPRRSISLYSPQSELDAEPALYHGFTPVESRIPVVPVEMSPSFGRSACYERRLYLSLIIRCMVR
ncbi:hypothetical protein SUGI_1500460 [Cryptomeria japonica]|nr:hypothetical protein SUGI_1500460 [Cryptomeria japonica]